MKKIILLFVLVFATTTLFAQNKDARDSAIIKLMNVKKGMVSVNSLAKSMSKNMDAKQTASFKTEIAVYKKDLIKQAVAKFKADYTAKEINAIYDECTSDKINYSDLTNGFFSKWRQLKGNLYFSKVKQAYFKHQ